MKNYLLMATAIMAMASCANDTDLSGGNPSALGDGSISFNMNTPAATRADGTEADATKLGKMFIVWGEKNETDGTKAGDANTVFKNYVVKYEDGTANTTTSTSTSTSTSNTNNWEYVGYTPYKSSQVSPSILADNNSTTKQTIKYWDDQATSYTFTAISALDKNINPSSGSATVVIAKNVGTESTESSSNTTAYDKGYTVNVKSGANVDSIFYSDRKVISKGDNGYNHQAVQLTFRNFMSKVRFGIYEIVPGYKVVITGIKYTTKAAEGETSSATEETHPKTTGSEGSQTTNKTFGITGNFIVPGDNTKFKVTYEDYKSNHENKAKVELVSDGTTTPSADTYLNTKGTTWLDATDGIGTAANNPTWDYVTTTTTQGEDGGSSTTTSTVNYTTILPNPSNTTNLKLQISYKLISEDTNEVIEFKETNGSTTTEIFRTVEVPYQYCQWKSNYAYSYLFKITDKSAELYPITFDAVVVSEETGKAETITTVTTPSITTIASRTDATSKKTTIVSEENEYKKDDVIYATVMENGNLVNLTADNTEGSSTTTGNIQLYTVTTTDATNYPITEASVAHALSQTTSVTSAKIVAKKIGNNNEGITAKDNLTNSVPTEDGQTIKLSTSESDTKALKWIAADATVYAIEYTKTENNNTTKTYKIVRINDATGQTQSSTTGGDDSQSTDGDTTGGNEDGGN